MRRKLTTQEFIEKANYVHKGRYNYSNSNYIKSSDKICIICQEHGEFWQTPNNHLKGQGCPKCKHELQSKKMTYNTQQFIDKANSIHYEKYDYSKSIYIGNKQPIIIICPVHGEFTQTPHDHLSGCGCPKCRISRQQTILYQKLLESFPSEDILFETDKRIVKWIGQQRFDIYFPKYNIAIEYNGRQHYVPVDRFGGQLEFENIQRRDKLKREKCLSNQCILLELKYDYSEQDYINLCSIINKIIKDYEFRTKTKS